MSYFVYILRSEKDGKRYVGMTNKLEHRINQHNAGRVISTKPRIPFKLEKVEEFPDRLSARSREKYFKTAAGRRFLREV